MTFTYTVSDSPSDLTLVRFHTTQTVEAESFVSDEEISMLIAQEGTWRKAVIAVLKFIIGKLSQPNFRADWLQVDNASARKGFEGLLAEKRREFGVPAISASAVHVYRADSLATEAPTYEDTNDDE